MVQMNIKKYNDDYDNTWISTECNPIKLKLIERLARQKKLYISFSQSKNITHVNYSLNLKELHCHDMGTPIGDYTNFKDFFIFILKGEQDV